MDTNNYTFYLGTYTNTISKGIYKFTLTSDGNFANGRAVAESSNPSFLALTDDNNYLIAVNENENGTTELFKLNKESAEMINTSSSGGAHPCFVTTTKDGYVLTANYTGGNIGLLKIDNSKLSELLFAQQHEGKGTTDRQKAPHAHSVWVKPNSNLIVACDLGTNELWFSLLNKEKNKLDFKTKIKMADGAGPRHLAFSKDGKNIYVVNELNCTITRLELIGEDYVVKESVTTLPENYNEPNTCADINITEDGKFIYASNRGHNSIAIYRVKNDATLELLGHEPTLGDGPRNFEMTPDNKFLLVANQKSDNIISFARNAETGLLTFAGKVMAPVPVCIVFEEKATK